MSYKFELELREKSRDELLKTHQQNMDDLDKLYKDMQASLAGNGSTFGIDKVDVEEKKNDIVTIDTTVKTLLESIDK